MSVVRNAIITAAELSTDERGFLDAWLSLDYGGSGQGFGGFTLYLPKSFAHHSLESPAGHFIFRVMEVAGVTKWSALPGCAIRVRKESEYALIDSIGHILKEDWFDPKADFAPLHKKVGAA